jgi:hypothetical protein
VPSEPGPGASAASPTTSQTDAQVDGKHLAVIGHSRLGKTSLWAGAQDERFGFVISNNSGEGGAALMRRDFGETTAIITKAFPHWFTKPTPATPETPPPAPSTCTCSSPSPRHVPSTSPARSEDQWADPKGRVPLRLRHAPCMPSSAKKATVVDEHPAIDSPVGDFIGYHVRTGKHDVTDFDWTQYLNFASRHWGRAG